MQNSNSDAYNISVANGDAPKSKMVWIMVFAIVVALMVLGFIVFSANKEDTTTTDEEVLVTSTPEEVMPTEEDEEEDILPTDTVENTARPTSEALDPVEDEVVTTIAVPSNWEMITQDDLSFKMYRPKGWYAWKYTVDKMSVNKEALPKDAQNTELTGYHFLKTTESLTKIKQDINATGTSVSESKFTTPLAEWTRIRYTNAGGQAVEVYVATVNSKTYKVVVNTLTDGETFVKLIAKV